MQTSVFMPTEVPVYGEPKEMRLKNEVCKFKTTVI